MKIGILHMFIAVIFVFIFAGCVDNANVNSVTSDVEGNADEEWNESGGDQDENRTADKELEAMIDSYISNMTLEEKVAQLFVVTPEALSDGDTVTHTDEALRQAFENYPVSGIVYFDKNLNNTEQTQQLLKDFQSFSNESIDLPIFNCVDEEGGSVVRIADKSGFNYANVGNMWDIGLSGDSFLAYEVGRTLGSYLSELGFNIDFAPTADVLTNAKNKVIGKRSFGSDPEVVAEMVVAELAGLDEFGVKGVVKHFPGHGATTGDTHKGEAFTEKSLEDMKTNELVPFQTAIDEGVGSIMVGHFSAPEVTGDNTPSSLSEVMITEVLREQMGFGGVVITDALDMDAITQSYSSASAAVKALKAGNDLLLMPGNFQEAFTGVLEAVNSGELSQERIDESVRRIIALKLSVE